MPRAKSSQLTLALLEKPRRGGARRGAGRKNRSGTRAHLRRESFNPRHPVHVTLKLVHGLPSLRTKDLFRCLRLAVRTARRRGIRIIHFAILSNHLHLIVETGAPSLFRELQSLLVSFARRINHLLNRAGAVFHGRYHARVLKTPTEARRALAYVLANDAKHRGAGEIRIDPFSSALAFGEWSKLYRKPPRLLATAWSEAFIETWHAEILSPASTWILRRGWLRARA